MKYRTRYSDLTQSARSQLPAGYGEGNPTLFALVARLVRREARARDGGDEVAADICRRRRALVIGEMKRPLSWGGWKTGRVQ